MRTSLMCIVPLFFLVVGCPASEDSSTAPEADAPAGTEKDSGPEPSGDTDDASEDVGDDTQPPEDTDEPDPEPLPDPQWTALGDLSQIRWGALLAPTGQPGGYAGFGGSQYPAGGVSNVTWTYDVATDTWSSEAPASAPPERYCHCLVALGDTGELLLVGGRDGSGGLPAAAWTYDVATATWKAIDGDVPAGTIGCHAGWLPKLGGGRAVVFGGQGLGVGMDDTTWTYDPTARSFTVHAPASKPSPRRDGATASDVAGGRVLVFGGQTGNTEHANDVWQFDGADWTQLSPQGEGPSPRRYPAAAFDPVRRLWVLFSGTEEHLDYKDLWLFDAKDERWIPLSMQGAPTERSFGAMIHDPGTDAYYLFGGMGMATFAGFSDAWRLDLFGAARSE